MICGGCSKVACQLSTEFPATDTSKPGHKWQCCTNAHVDFFLTPASTFTCECLWKAFQPYMYYKIHWIWQAHTLAHALSWVFPYAHTHLFLLHDITYMHSSLNTVPNNISRMCRWITAIKALTNRAWTQTAVTAGQVLNRYILQYSNSYWETKLHSYVDSQSTEAFMDSCVFQY